MKFYFVNSRVILNKTLKYATIVNVNHDNGNLVVCYYNNENKMVYELITNDDIITDEQYEIIKNRTNTIIDILK